MRLNPDGSLTLRWRENGTHHQRTLTEERIVALLRQEHRPQTPTITELAVEWWEAVGQHRAPSTRKLYDWLIGSFIAPSPLGAVEVGDLTPAMVEDWNLDLDTGPVARGKAQTLLGQIVKRAVKAGHIQTNPVELADRPKAPPRKPIQPPSVLEVERLRAKARPRDAMAIGLMAYCGLAPVDAFAVEWSDWRGGVLSGTRRKSGEQFHIPLARVMPTVAEDLSSWRGNTIAGPIVGPRDVANWRKRVWYPLGADTTPYSLRHLAVSLWLRDPDVTELEAQRWAGHGPAAQRGYSHIIAQGPQSAEEAIQAARMELAGYEREVEDRA